MGIQWGRIVILALLLEAVLIAMTIPIAALVGMEAFVPYVAPTLFVVSFLLLYWLGRGFKSRRALHGALVAVVATLIYLALVMSQPDGLSSVMSLYGPFQFVFANVLRFAGCIAGTVAAKKAP